ncbi:metalloregulator ArsR/SmtB family transcription factor [Janibacter alkaliphilus]|uniref:DNA-binding transcriptional ArsR family regulator n=1 Tax=Janibacter alkaliphilus TaxID=1069963 RepID=A0A852X6C7_9MICO|nr:metalloregulator ArsR/SmtB family transcription factor [Janibacter alkaliphilus]NYG37988.1 DNA-binding transcriptional ArsR family regulator [Janibacter alkaliphilus]
MKQATDPLSRVFSALADPTRRGILDRLSQGESTVGELTTPFGMSQPAISQHLRVLEDAGLITRTRQAQYRICAARPEGLSEADDWVSRHREIWTGRLDRLEETITGLTTD